MSSSKKNDAAETPTAGMFMAQLQELLGEDVGKPTPVATIIKEVTNEIRVEKRESTKKKVREAIDKLVSLDNELRKAEEEIAKQRKKFDNESQQIMKKLRAMLGKTRAPKPEELPDCKAAYGIRAASVGI